MPFSVAEDLTITILAHSAPKSIREADDELTFELKSETQQSGIRLSQKQIPELLAALGQIYQMRHFLSRVVDVPVSDDVPGKGAPTALC